MKKLIKLMFPKTYQAILNEGYYNAFNEYNNDYNHEDYDNHDDYDYDYTDQDEQDELLRLHNEHYAKIAEDEYQLELTRLYEEECKREREALIKLYTPKEPLLSVGDKIHLHSKQGMYTVTKVSEFSFAYCTQYSEDSYADYTDYKCYAGGKWNRKKN